jgi:hypothetical protein
MRFNIQFMKHFIPFCKGRQVSHTYHPAPSRCHAADADPVVGRSDHFFPLLEIYDSIVLLYKVMISGNN